MIKAKNKQVAKSLISLFNFLADKYSPHKMTLTIESAIVIMMLKYDPNIMSANATTIPIPEVVWRHDVFDTQSSTARNIVMPYTPPKRLLRFAYSIKALSRSFDVKSGHRTSMITYSA